VTGTVNGTGNASSTPIQINVPFDFCLGGQDYSSSNALSIDYNGWIAFGNPSINATTRQAPLTNFNNSISAFGVGLRTTGTSSITIRVVGASPNRVLVIQWGQRYFGDSEQSPFIGNNYWRRVNVPNMNNSDSPGNNDRLHFQIRLYETTNVIEFQYCITQARNTVPGNRDAGITNNIQVGLRGASAADFNVRTKTTTNSPWNNNTVAGTALPSGSTNTMTFNNFRQTANNRPSSVRPASPGNNSNTAGAGTSTIFRWTPVGVIGANMDDVGCFSAIALPVELTAFDVEVDDNINRVYWSTASEQNSDYFEVERSLNGADWDVVGRVQSAGNSSASQHYELNDREFERTINYYRLSQVDFDGTTKVFDIISADNRNLKNELIKIVNTMGQEVNQFYKGVIIEVYSDGSTRRLYRN